MAPGLTVTSSAPAQEQRTITKKNNAPLHIFPDGIKTSGQHPPQYDLLRPYSDFPLGITGPTAWDAAEYKDKPEKWTHPFTAPELDELSTAADDFLASTTTLTGISQQTFPLPNLSRYLASVRHELLNGRGFILFKHLPVRAWGLQKTAVAYMGLGTYLGYFVSQNGKGHVLGHVKDLGEDASQIDKVRIYRTNARQYFHTDWCDLVGLLCVARALEGGESDICSSHAVYNVLRRERPDVLETLTRPEWYFDRKGEVSEGEDGWVRSSVFYLEREASPGGGPPRVFCKWDPYFIRSLTRFSNAGLIPALSPAQVTAAAVLEETCHRLALHMVLEVGDIQFLSNAQVLHARTEYRDNPPPLPRRHLMRLWLATPAGEKGEEEGGAEGGWRLPFADWREKKRGGIQVDGVGPVAELDAA